MTICFSHLDADGICSARIVKLFFPDTKIVVPPYGFFGVSDGMIKVAYGHDVFVTDLGTRLCRPSEVVLDILPFPQKGAFSKEDGEKIIDENGLRIK